MREPVPVKTAGMIASDLNVELHRVNYVIRARKIAHAQRAGIVRLYDPAGVKRIAEALAALPDRRWRDQPAGAK